MTELLGRLPLQAWTDAEQPQVLLADIARLAEIRGLERPDPAVIEDMKRWDANLQLNFTTTEALEVAQFSPDYGYLNVPIRSWIHMEKSRTEADARELGFLRTGVDSFAAIEDPQPIMHVVSGDLDVSQELTDADPYLKIGSAAEGDTDVPNRTMARSLGRSYFVATQPDRVAISSRSANVDVWLASDTATLADEPGFALVAEEFDRVGVLGAWIFASPSNATTETPELLAVGAALVEDVPTNVIVYVFATSDDAQASVGEVEQAWSVGTDPTRPLSDNLMDLTVTQKGRTVVVTAAPPPGKSTITAFSIVRELAG